MQELTQASVQVKCFSLLPRSSYADNKKSDFYKYKRLALLKNLKTSTYKQFILNDLFK